MTALVTPLVIFLLAGALIAGSLSLAPVAAGLFALALVAHAAPAILRNKSE